MTLTQKAAIIRRVFRKRYGKYNVKVVRMEDPAGDWISATIIEDPLVYMPLKGNLVEDAYTLMYTALAKYGEKLYEESDALTTRQVFVLRVY